MLKRLNGLAEARSLILLAAVWLYFNLTVVDWFTDTTFQGLLGRAVPIGILGAGFTVCLLCGRIDLSVGANFALAGVLFAALQPHLGLTLAILLALVAGGVVGAINGTLVAALGVDSFIASLGTLLLCRGIAFVVSSGEPLNATDLNASLKFNESLIGPLSYRILVLIVVVLALHVFISRTRVGRDIVATGGDEVAARANGVPTRARIATAFVVSGTAAAIAGVTSALALLSGSPIVGDQELLAAVAAVFLGGAALTGGRGSVMATGLAAVALASLTTGMELRDIGVAWQSVVIGAAVLIASAPALRAAVARARPANLRRTRGRGVDAGA
jgi:erythritol transport system permease protein